MSSKSIFPILLIMLGSIHCVWRRNVISQVKEACTSQMCTCCLNSVSCSQFSGWCGGQCQDGYHGAKCWYKCPSNCATCRDVDNPENYSSLVNYAVCTKCKPGFYSTAESYQCQYSCPRGCSTCNSATDCTSCMSGFYESDTTCIKCQAGCVSCTSSDQCVQCQNGYFNVGWSNGYLNCTPCSIGCEGRLCNNESGSCSPCKQNYIGSKCDRCKDRRYGYSCTSECHSYCATCISFDNCTSCVSGYYLQETRCIPCAHGCATCTSDGHCTQCRDWYYSVGGFSGNLNCTLCSYGCKDPCDKVSGYCIPCTESYIGNKCERCVDGRYGGECQFNCDTPCKSCISSSKCTSCVSGYYLQGTRCIPCAPGCATCTSDGHCTQCKYWHYSFGGFSEHLNCTLCSYGCRDPCDKASGSCFHCKENYIGNKCERCVDGKYGGSCQFNCDKGCYTCISSGECTSCVSGYNLQGNKCQPCKNGCSQCSSPDTCIKCSGGYYMSVSGVCSPCSLGCTYQSQCNIQTGICSCKNGFAGEKCNQCAPHFQTYPYCNGCIPGYQGILCDHPCPARCKGNICDRYNKVCTHGCNENFAGDACTICTNGWFGSNCDTLCPDNCYGGSCNQSTGYCHRCQDNFAGNSCENCVTGRYGTDCNLSCPYKCANVTCARISGNCDRCIDGFSGDKCCLEGPGCKFCLSDAVCSECVAGKHGEKCDLECPTNCENNICDKSNGTCITCKDGFQGEKCILPLIDQPLPAGSVPVGTIAGGAAGFVIVIILVVMVLVIFKQRSCNKNNTKITMASPEDLVADQVYANEGENQSMSNTQENVYDNITNLELPSLSAAPRKDKGMPLPTEAVSNLDFVVKLDKEAKLDRFKPDMTVQPRRSSKPNKVSLEASTSLEQPPVLMVNEPDLREDDDEDEYYNSAASLKKGIPVSELAKYVSKKASAFFSTEFEKLPKGLVKSTAAALLDQNIGKNRYNEIYPYDETRVVLTEPGSDFINACYIEGYRRKRGYIASLGPIAKATEDYKTFWRMVWQEKAKKIVMVTNLMECGVMKCEQYWPDKNATLVYGDVTVKCHSEDVYAEYTVRSFTVCKEKEQRSLHHIHYTAWPDKGVPDDVTSLVEFRNKVNSTKTELNGPVIVHCSAGVGRTGTYIALDILTRKGKDKGRVDIFDCVEKLRQQRTYMVQTDEQYEYLHRALVHTLTLGSEAIPADRFQAYTTSLSDAIFYLLSHCTEKVSDDEKEAIARNQSYKTYNRPGADIPGNMNRPRLYLDRTTEDNNYINGIFINSFKRKNQFILTQTPLPNTVNDFLTLVVQENCCCIVSMDAPDVRDKTIGTYLPADNQILNTNAYEVKSTNMDSNQSYCQRTLTITSKKTSSTVTVQHFVCVNWPNKAKAPKSPPEFLGFVQQIQKVADASTQFSPVIVHCRTGSERSAIICVVLNLLQKIEIEHEVSVINTVRQVRVRRSKAIPNKEQFKFCHQCVSAYLQSFDIYSNFS